jgi:hypothetical protein
MILGILMVPSGVAACQLFEHGVHGSEMTIAFEVGRIEACSQVGFRALLNPLLSLLLEQDCQRRRRLHVLIVAWRIASLETRTRAESGIALWEGKEHPGQCGLRWLHADKVHPDHAAQRLVPLAGTRHEARVMNGLPGGSGHPVGPNARLRMLLPAIGSSCSGAQFAFFASMAGEQPSLLTLH